MVGVDTERRLKHVNPDTTSAEEYLEQILHYNHSVQKHAGKQLKRLLQGHGNHFAIATTGSDGRLEKGPVSPLEFVIIAGERARIDEILPRIYALTYLHPTMFDRDVEVKQLGQDTMFVYNPNPTIHLISPNRVLDLKRIHGHRGIFRKAKRQLAEELVAPEGDSVYRKIKRKTKEHARVTETGVQRYRQQDLVHVDFEDGTLTYNPEQAQWGVKQGPLRLVQYALVRDVIRELRMGTFPDRVLWLSTNTGHKLERLRDERLTQLSEQQVSDLVNNYHHFLFLYHRSQEAYHGRLETITRTDPQELRERSADLAQLCRGHIIEISR